MESTVLLEETAYLAVAMATTQKLAYNILILITSNKIIHFKTSINNSYEVFNLMPTLSNCATLYIEWLMPTLTLQTYQLLNARLWYLQCISTGDTAVLY